MGKIFRKTALMAMLLLPTVAAHEHRRNPLCTSDDCDNIIMVNNEVIPKSHGGG